LYKKRTQNSTEVSGHLMESHTHTPTRVTQQSGEVNDYFCLSPHTHTHWREVCVFIDLLSSGWGSLFYEQSALFSWRRTRVEWGQGSEVRGRFWS